MAHTDMWIVKNVQVFEPFTLLQSMELKLTINSVGGSNQIECMEYI